MKDTLVHLNVNNMVKSNMSSVRKEQIIIYMLKHVTILTIIIKVFNCENVLLRFYM